MLVKVYGDLHLSVNGFIQDSSQHFIYPTGQVDLVGQSLNDLVHVIRSDGQSSNPYYLQFSRFYST